jgi:hypothetical protein
MGCINTSGICCFRTMIAHNIRMQTKQFSCINQCNDGYIRVERKSRCIIAPSQIKIGSLLQNYLKFRSTLLRKFPHWTIKICGLLFDLYPFKARCQTACVCAIALRIASLVRNLFSISRVYENFGLPFMCEHLTRCLTV